MYPDLRSRVRAAHAGGGEAALGAEGGGWGWKILLTYREILVWVWVGSRVAANDELLLNSLRQFGQPMKINSNTKHAHTDTHTLLLFYIMPNGLENGVLYSRTSKEASFTHATLSLLIHPFFYPLLVPVTLSLTHDTHSLPLSLSPPFPSGCVLEPVNSKTMQHLVSMIGWVYSASLGLVHSSHSYSSFCLLWTWDESGPLPLNSHESFNHDTIFLSLSLPPFLLCVPFLSSHVLNSPFAVCPFSSTMAFSPRSRSFCSSPFHVTSLSLSASTSPYCRALMSTLARSVNYSITGRRISHPPRPPLLCPKIGLCWEWIIHSY